MSIKNLSSKLLKARAKPITALIALILSANVFAQANYTESLSSTVGLEMVFVQGGTFQMGCSGSPTPACGQNESPVRSVTVSDYYIGKYEVTRGQWQAVMGSVPSGFNVTNNHPVASVDWYDAVNFVCELNRRTGKKYRLPTEAEWEFAAKGGRNGNHNFRYSGSNNAADVAVFGSTGFSPSAVGTRAANQLGLHDMSGNVREWVYDAWNQSYPSADQTNPTGAPIIHIQKIRRGGGFMTPANEATVTARKIRSIEGADGDLGLRLAISSNQNTMPAGMVDPCDIKRPPVSHGKGTMRDDRLITGDSHVWVNEMTFNNQTWTSMLKIWDDGTAVFRPSFGSAFSGEWATGNDWSLYIMNSSGTRNKYIYYVVSPQMEITLMPENDMPNRWEFKAVGDVSGAANITKPSRGSRTPEQIVPAGSVADMSNPPTNRQDARLISATNRAMTAGQAWIQDNVALGAGGTHRYRFDYHADTARFVVWDVGMNSSVIISAGKWFTIDNTFLRIIGSNGRRYDYLYSVVPATTGANARAETHYHISFQGYERGDFRMFEKMTLPLNSNLSWREPTMAPYATGEGGGSTYEPPSSAHTNVASQNHAAIRDNVRLLTIRDRALNVNAPAGSKVDIRVVNLTGKTVASFNTTGAANLTLRKIPAGAYIVEAKVDGRKMTQSVVLR
ncbi:MAG: SUMF1/EgtB/PvdO family nonheme iron enzyme [Chitinispirillia bacterium]|nr:SUMF1/EgtB/PvdO family nonheme iron enzyme [Chitinispirillia bacterium]